MGELERYGFLSLALLIVLFLVLSFVGPDVVDGATLAAGPATAAESPAPEHVVTTAAAHAAPVAPPTAPTAPDDSALATHVVARGETLSEIAKRRLGRATDWPLLVEWNPGVDPKRLRVGQSLRLPPATAVRGRSTATTLAPAPNDAAKPSRSAARVAHAKEPSSIAARIGKRPKPSAPRHTVRADDTLWEISVRYYRSAIYWKDIWKANRDLLPDPSRLTPGAVLELP